LDAYSAGTIDVALSPPRLSGRISDRPTVSPLVRLQASEGAAVTNQKNETVWLTDLARHVVNLLDGIHSTRDVGESVDREVRSGNIGNDWTVRLREDEIDSRRLTADILRYLQDHALLVA
jgi:methyltransferase-like protein